MRVRKRGSDALELGGIALVDILANSVAAILVLITLRLGIASRELGSSTEQRKSEHAAVVLARRLSKIAATSDLPSSGQATLHDYPRCDAKRDESPAKMPTIELHSTYVLIRNTGVKLDRSELLSDSNRLDLYLRTLPKELRGALRCDIFDIQLYYIALSILVENGIGLPSHYHFISESPFPTPRTAEPEQSPSGNKVTDFESLMAELKQRKQLPPGALLHIPGLSAPRLKPQDSFSRIKSRGSPHAPQKTPMAKLARLGTVRFALLKKPHTPPVAESSPPAVVTPPAVPNPSPLDAGVSEGKSSEADGTTGREMGEDGGSRERQDGGVSHGGTSQGEMKLAQSPPYPPSPPVAPVGTGAGQAPFSDAEFQKRASGQGSKSPSGGINSGNYGDAIVLTIDEQAGANDEEVGRHGGFSVRTYQTGIIAALPPDILDQLGIKPLLRVDGSQLGADDVGDFLMQLVFSVNLAERANARAGDGVLQVPLRRPGDPPGPELSPAKKPLMEAVAEAQVQRKPLVAYVGTSSCGPCQVFQAGILPHPTVQQALLRVTLLHYDVESEPGLTTARQLRVTAYPTFVALGSGGAELSRLEGLPTVDSFRKWLESLSQPKAEARGPAAPPVGAMATKPREVREVTSEQVAAARRYIELFRSIFATLRKNNGPPQPLQLQHQSVGPGESVLSLRTGALITEAGLRVSAMDALGAVAKAQGQISLKLRPQPFPSGGFRALLSSGTLVLPGKEDQTPGLRWRRIVVQNVAQRLVVEGYVLADLQNGQLDIAAEANELIVDGVPSMQIPRPHPRLLLMLIGWGLVIGLLLLCTLKSRRPML